MLMSSKETPHALAQKLHAPHRSLSLYFEPETILTSSTESPHLLPFSLQTTGFSRCCGKASSYLRRPPLIFYFQDGFLRLSGVNSKHWGCTQTTTPQQTLTWQQPTPCPMPPPERKFFSSRSKSFHIDIRPRSPSRSTNRQTTNRGSPHHRSGPDPTVGLTVEQNKAQQRALEIRLNDARDVFRQALDTLRGCCPPCWARGCRYKHDLKSCKAEVANDQDKHWSAWHSKAFQFEDGYCFQCLIPQTRRRGVWHVWLNDNSNCEDKHILKPALYAFVTASKRPLHVEEYPALPDNLLPPSVNEDLFVDISSVVHLLLLWLIFKRGLVDVPPSLQFVLTDRGDRR
ncbi:hypothetical protein B0H14DRAFT_2575929 [Mycena olivaceomarginata]|nr:hypothetical protein B0H14DRAFT_2575929 [Mycena olivaceomarginata]